MRLAAQEKLGFYPAANTEMQSIAKHLALGTPGSPTETHNILDPCCGQGEAIATLQESLGCPQTSVWAIELDEARGQAANARLGSGTVLAPCSFMGTAIESRSFGLIYANPPFDDELGGGGREELAFLRRAENLLCKNGILVFVAPWATMTSGTTAKYLDTHYDGRLWRFQSPKFRECVFIGQRRSTPLLYHEVYGQGWLHSSWKCGQKRWQDEEYMKLPPVGWPHWCDGPGHWEVPPCWRPRLFKQITHTDAQLAAELAKSPLNSLATAIRKPKPKRPPLAMDGGHLTLTIASGQLDGLVQLPGHVPHVMKCVETKTKYLNEDLTETKLSTDGKSVTIKETWSEQAVTKIHAVEPDGRHYAWVVGETKTEEVKTKTERRNSA